MKLIWSPKVRQDLRGIARHIGSDNPRAAKALIQRIRRAAGLLTRTPHMGRPGRVEGSRELVISGTSYILPYRITAET
jgi:plasmid stabilization system protein ParE